MAVIDLTTVQNVRTWMPTPANTPSAPTLAQQTAILQAAITALSLDFLRRTGNAPVGGQVPTTSLFNQPVTFSEVYDGNGGNRMFLRHCPIISVSSLTAGGAALPASSGPGTAGWTIDSSGKSIALVSGLPGYPYTPVFPLAAVAKFPRGVQNIAITYSAGFNTVAVVNELQTIPATSPYIVAPDFALLADGGVKYFSSGNPLTPVQIAPLQGQYFLNNGTYLFNAADAGVQILLAYTAAGTPPDIELAARKTIFLTYQRRGWEGLSSLMKPDAGSTNYTKWELDPDVVEVLRNYTRTAIV